MHQPGLEAQGGRTGPVCPIGRVQATDESVQLHRELGLGQGELIEERHEGAGELPGVCLTEQPAMPRQGLHQQELAGVAPDERARAGGAGQDPVLDRSELGPQQGAVAQGRALAGQFPVQAPPQGAFRHQDGDVAEVRQLLGETREQLCGEDRLRVLAVGD
jgi:hypothetical protein